MNLAYQPIMMMIFSQLAYGVDQLQARGIFPRKGESDVCDLLKHVRNAMAHGFYFSFDSRKVIPRPLTVGGLTLSFEHNGRSIDRVIGPGDLLDILDGVDVLADVLDSGVSTSADGA